MGNDASGHSYSPKKEDLVPEPIDEYDFSKNGKKLKTNSGTKFMISQSSESISSMASSQHFSILASSYEAIVFNVGEYLDLMASSVIKGRKTPTYDVPWMRRGCDHQDFSDWVQDSLDMFGFDDKLQILEMGVSRKKGVKGYKQKKALTSVQKWNNLEKSMQGLFAFMDLNFIGIFGTDFLCWRELQFTQLFPTKETKRKWVKNRVFGTLATEFFAMLKTQNLSLYGLTPGTIGKLVTHILKKEKVKFSINPAIFSGQRLFQFLIVHIIKRARMGLNFYYTDLCILGKMFLSLSKVYKGMKPFLLPILHESFYKHSLSSMFQVMNSHLSEKHMFLCFGVSNIGDLKNMSSFDRLLKRLVSNAVVFGSNHTFFVLGGLLFDWNSSMMMHIQPLAGKEVFLCFGFSNIQKRSERCKVFDETEAEFHKDEINPEFMEKWYICSIVAELYWFNCFSMYRNAKKLEGQTKYRNNCHDVCKKLLNGVFKDRFSTVSQNFTLVPPEVQAESWKAIVQDLDTKFIPTKDLASVLKKKITKRLFSDLKKLTVFFENEKVTFEGLPSSDLCFVFGDREILDRFMKMFFYPTSLDGVGLTIENFPKDKVILKSMDRALVLRVNQMVKKPLKETTSLGPDEIKKGYKGVFKPSESNVSENSDGTQHLGLKHKSELTKPKKPKKFKWFFNRSCEVHTFMSAKTILLGIKDKTDPKRDKNSLKDSKSPESPTSTNNNEVLIEIREDYVEKEKLPLNSLPFKDVKTKYIGDEKELMKLQALTDEQVAKEIYDETGKYCSKIIKQ